MGLFDLFGGGGDAGAGYQMQGNGYVSRASDAGYGIGQLTGDNAANYNKYNPYMTGAYANLGQYWNDLANNGYTDTQKSQLLGDFAPQSAFDQITGAENQAKLKGQLSGTDTPENAGPSSVAGGAAAYYMAARDALKQGAQARLGREEVNLRPTALRNAGEAYGAIANPAYERASQGYGQQADIYGRLAGMSYDQAGQERARQAAQQQQLMGLIGGVGSAIGGAFGGGGAAAPAAAAASGGGWTPSFNANPSYYGADGYPMWQDTTTWGQY